MSVLIESEKQLGAARKLQFCYICGEFIGRGTGSRDHVPPKSIFANTDRHPVLVLRSHESCNNARSGEDEVVGQVLSLLHGRRPKPERWRPKLSPLRSLDGTIETVALQFRLEPVLHRWLQGFHAALYREHLEGQPGTRFSTILPFTSGRSEGTRIVVDEIPNLAYTVVATLKKNRAVANVDRLAAYNGKLKYECVWGNASDGTPVCVYGFDLYGWIELGDVSGIGRRGCVGLYIPSKRQFPIGASRETELAFNLRNREPLDPFGA